MSSKKRSRRASVAVARLSGSSVNSISRRSSTSVLSTGVVMFCSILQYKIRQLGKRRGNTIS